MHVRHIRLGWSNVAARSGLTRHSNLAILLLKDNKGCFTFRMMFKLIIQHNLPLESDYLGVSTTFWLNVGLFDSQTEQRQSRYSRHTFSTLVLNTGAPQLRPLLFILHTYGCNLQHSTINQISTNNMTSSQEEINNLTDRAVLKNQYSNIMQYLFLWYLFCIVICITSWSPCQIPVLKFSDTKEHLCTLLSCFQFHFAQLKCKSALKFSISHSDVMASVCSGICQYRSNKLERKFWIKYFLTQFVRWIINIMWSDVFRLPRLHTTYSSALFWHFE